MKPFLIRRISTTADGREIVRDAPATHDVVKVGRAATNDIALPDLGVDPEHLQIEHGSDGLVLVTATGNNDFLVGQRRRKQAVIDPDQGGDIGLGGHRITMTRDVGCEIVLTVQRIAAISKAAEERDETKAFSLRGLLPAKRGTAWALVVAVLIGFLAIPSLAALQKQHHDARTIYAARSDASWSSGPLSQAHHALEGNCEACHKKAFVSVRDETCQSCHKDVHDHAPLARLGKARETPGFGGQVLVSVAKALSLIHI